MKQKRLFIIIGAIVLIIGLAAGSYFFLQATDGENGGSEVGQETDGENGESGEIENDPPDGIQYHENGEIRAEVWGLNGQLHRENDLPAVIEYDENGEIEVERWYLNGEFIKRESAPLLNRTGIV